MVDSNHKISRNAHCSCGSGRKYKRCCEAQSGDDRTEDFSYTEDLAIILGIHDERFDSDWKKLILGNPSRLQSHVILNDLGHVLGVLGYPEKALHFQEKALQKRPQNPLYKLNLASTLSTLDRDQEAYDLAVGVPENTARKAIILGNIIHDLQSPSEAIPFFEKAITEEPNFFLPYVKLIHAIEGDNEIKSFWIDRAYTKFPTNPDVVMIWVGNKLSNEKKWYELNGSWFSALDPSPDRSVINSDITFMKNVEYLSVVDKIARSNSTCDPVFLQNAIDMIPQLPQGYRCETLVYMIGTAIELGCDTSVPVIFNCLCNDCAERYEVKELIFDALIKKGDKVQAIELAKDILKSSPKNEMIIVDYFSALDDIGKTAEAVNEIVRLLSLYDLKKIITQTRIYYDLAFYSSKVSSWEITKWALEKFESLDTSTVRLLNVRFEDIVDNCLFIFNKIIALVALKEFTAAQSEIERVQKIFEMKRENEIPFDVELYEVALSDAWKVLHFAKSTSHTTEYQNAFSRCLKGTFYENFSGRPTKTSINVSFSTIMLQQNSDKISDTVARMVTAFKLKTAEDSDYSHYLNDIADFIPNLRALNSEILETLIDADIRLFSPVKSFNFSPLVFSYSKALELFLRYHVLTTFRIRLEGSDDADTVVAAANADKNVNQYRGFLSFLKNGRIELGTSQQTLKLCSGKTAERVELLSRLQRFLSSNYPNLIGKVTIDRIGNVAENFRNIAVHERSLLEKDALFVREEVLNIIGANFRLRLVEVGDQGASA